MQYGYRMGTANAGDPGPSLVYSTYVFEVCYIHTHTYIYIHGYEPLPTLADLEIYRPISFVTTLCGWSLSGVTGSHLEVGKLKLLFHSLSLPRAVHGYDPLPALADLEIRRLTSLSLLCVVGHSPVLLDHRLSGEERTPVTHLLRLLRPYGGNDRPLADRVP